MKNFYSMLAALFMLHASIFAQTNTNPCAGLAKFQFVIDGSTVKFTAAANSSASPIVHKWNFGDGTTANSANPVHQYTNGSYRVVHYIKDTLRNCYDSAVAEFQIPVSNNLCSGLAKFGYGIYGDTVKFYSPNNLLVHYWKLGDGSTSEKTNPVHVYAPGNYRVVHYIKDTVHKCYDSAVVEFTINKNVECPKPSFRWHNDSLNTRAVKFYNTTGPLPAIYKFTWQFGDGSSSAEPDPVHVYADTGVYNACLIIEELNGLCKNYSCQYINVPPVCDIKPDFKWESTAGNPLKIYFKNTSLPTTTPNVKFTWSFGDGTSSSEVNPVHGYTLPGIYKVCLKMQLVNSNCVKEICKEVVIRPGCDNLFAKFEWKKDSLHPLRGIQFINLSSPLAGVQPRVKWDFGDGEGSNEWSPFHQYKCPGTYKVCLYIEFFPGCLKQYCTEVVIVYPPCENLKPAFEWVTDAAHPMRGVKFINKSTIICDTPVVRWNFGDGTESGEWNPFHQYTHPGEYKVCLKVGWKNDCVKELCKTILIQRPDIDCKEISEFRYERVTSDSSGFYFVAKYRNPNWKYIWTFGDGKGMQGDVARHRYERPGKYTVCLTVYKSDECASTNCMEVIAGSVLCNDFRFKFEYTKGTDVPNRVKFHALSNVTLGNVKWLIYSTNSTVLTPVILFGTDPSYTFNQTGLYKVCAIGYSNTGCSKQYCDTIRIDKIVTPQVCEIKVYPNPASNYIEFDVQAENNGSITVNIFDITGIKRKQFSMAVQAGNNHIRIPVESLAAGFYTLEVIHSNGRVCKGKFQKL